MWWHSGFVTDRNDTFLTKLSSYNRTCCFFVFMRSSWIEISVFQLYSIRWFQFISLPGSGRIRKSRWNRREVTFPIPIDYRVIPNLYLITGGLAGVLYLWPVFRQNVFVKPLQIKGHNNSCCYIDYSSFCRLMATSAQDHNLIIWKTSSQNCVVCFIIGLCSSIFLWTARINGSPDRLHALLLFPRGLLWKLSRIVLLPFRQEKKHPTSYQVRFVCSCAYSL